MGKTTHQLYRIMQSNMYVMNDNKSYNVRWMLHGNISRNSYGNAVIGSYGGYFEEDVWLMCRRTRGSSPTRLDVLAKYAQLSM